MLILDGATGEGGGQVLRTSLALAALLGQPFELRNIRAARPKPGLAAQHLTSVRAVAQIAAAALAGDDFGSQTLRFEPRRRQGGQYVFDVADIKPSAGATGLIVQAILPPLLFCREPSSVILRGGTHVAWSPHYHYLAEVFLPTLALMGARVQVELVRAGWYPLGGGEVRLRVQPVEQLQPLELTSRGKLQWRGWSALSNLPEHILRRQVQGAEEVLRPGGISQVRWEHQQLPARGKGTCCFLVGESGPVRVGFTGLGERGKRAEKVGAAAAEQAVTYQRTGQALEEHLADQLILYLALAAGRSAFTASRLSLHLLTNIWVVEQFLAVKFTVVGQEGEPGRVEVEGVGMVN